MTSRNFLTRSAVVCISIWALSAQANAADNFAYMGTLSGQFGTIDLDTGSFTQLGSTGQTLAGMAVANGSLYASSYHTMAQLFSINTSNGSLTLIGSAPGVTYADFGSTTDGLFAMGTNANLYSVNPTSGSATLVGSIGLALSNSVQSLSTNSSSLYFVNGNSLYTLNTITAAPTLVGDIGGPLIGAMVVEDGKLYGGINSGNLGVGIATLSTTTGSATSGASLTGTTSGFFALAPYPIPAVPEPSILAMLIIGLLGIGSSSRIAAPRTRAA